MDDGGDEETGFQRTVQIEHDNERRDHHFQMPGLDADSAHFGSVVVGGGIVFGATVGTATGRIGYEGLVVAVLAATVLSALLGEDGDPVGEGILSALVGSVGGALVVGVLVVLKGSSPAIASLLSPDYGYRVVVAITVSVVLGPVGGLLGTGLDVLRRDDEDEELDFLEE